MKQDNFQIIKQQNITLVHIGFFIFQPMVVLIMHNILCELSIFPIISSFPSHHLHQGCPSIIILNLKLYFNVIVSYSDSTPRYHNHIHNILYRNCIYFISCKIRTFSRQWASWPKPFLSHSLAVIVFDADSAVKEERASDRVCLLLEKSRSTKILTPGIARTSCAIRASTGKSLTWF